MALTGRRARLLASVLLLCACRGPVLSHDTWCSARPPWRGAPGGADAAESAAVTLLRFCRGGRVVALHATLRRSGGRVDLEPGAPLALYEGDWWTVAAEFATRTKLTRAVPVPREFEPLPERSERVVPRGDTLEAGGVTYEPLPFALPDACERLLSCREAGPVTHD